MRQLLKGNEAIAEADTLLVWIVIARTDGAELRYPGLPASALPRGYDPRNEAWYRAQTAADAPESGCAEPYLSPVNGEWLLPCSERIAGADAKLRGVALLAFSLDELARRSLLPADSAAQAAWLVADDGHVVGRQPVDDRPVALAGRQLEHPLAQRGHQDRRGLLGAHPETEAVHLEGVVGLCHLLAAQGVAEEPHHVAHLLVRRMREVHQRLVVQRKGLRRRVRLVLVARIGADGDIALRQRRGRVVALRSGRAEQRVQLGRDAVR